MLRSLIVGLLFLSSAIWNQVLSQDLAQTLTQSSVQSVVWTVSLFGRLPVQSFKARRDNEVVKQNFDFSCGAASLATLLSFYGKSVSEKELMDAMAKDKSEVSFDDMVRVLPLFGFKAIGLAVSWDQILGLRVPVLVYLKTDKQDHFSIVRGVSHDAVQLADPSWGNRRLLKHQFLSYFMTHTDKKETGKLLLVLPLDAENNKINHTAWQAPVSPKQLFNTLRANVRF